MPPALALGTGITALGVMRCLGPAGIAVYQVAPDAGCERHSRWCSGWINGRAGAAAAHLEDLLVKLPWQKAVLVPCSDTLNAAVAELPPGIKVRFPCSQPSAQTQAALVDKGHLAQCLTEAGIPHPRTIRVESAEQLAELQSDLFRDAILKPRNSQVFFACYRVKAFRITSRAEALERFEQVQRDGHAVTLQQYVPGPASHHYFVDGFVDRHGHLCGLFARRRLRMYPPDFGNSSYMVSIPAADVQPCQGMLERLFAHTSYRGVFSTEFKYDATDRTFKLLEINTRPWWYIEFAQLCGMPLAMMAYRDALEQNVERVQEYRVGVRLVYPYFDFHSCLRPWREGRLTLRAWAASWLSAKQALFSWRDPLPSVVSLGRGVARRVMRRLKRGRTVSGQS